MVVWIRAFALAVAKPNRRGGSKRKISGLVLKKNVRSLPHQNTVTSDHHLGITHCRKTVPPSRNPCDSDPFWSQLTIDVRLHENQFLYARSRMKRHISLFFLSTAERRLTADHLNKIFCTRLRSRMGGIFRSLLSTAERRLTRAISETQSRMSYELK